MLYVFEGADGSGKSSLAKAVAEKLAAYGHSVVLSKEPGGTDFGMGLRPLLLSKDSKVSPLAEYYALLADRAQHLEEVVIPAILDSRIVILDRHLLSTLVYQVQRGIDEGRVRDDYRRLFLDVLTGMGVRSVSEDSDGLGVKSVENWLVGVSKALFVPHYIVCDAPDYVLDERLKGRGSASGGDKWDDAAEGVKKAIRASYRRESWGDIGFDKYSSSVTRLDTNVEFDSLVESVAMGICAALPKAWAFNLDGTPRGTLQVPKTILNLQLTNGIGVEVGVS